MRAICANPASPLGENDFFRNQTGKLGAIDAEKVGRVALALGAGRERAGDRIDPRAGVTLAVKVGDRVAVGAPLATLEKATGPEGLEKAAADLYKAFQIAPTAPEPKPLILECIGDVPCA